MATIITAFALPPKKSGGIKTVANSKNLTINLFLFRYSLLKKSPIIAGS